MNTDQVFHKVVEFKKITQILKRFHTEYEFSAQDAFVFHDENTLYAFSELFPSFKKVTQIHHCQGSRYNEFKAMNGYQNEEMRKILNYIHQKSLTKYIHFGFPSNGAYEELIKTEPDFIPLLENKTLHVLYNGYDRKEDIAPSQGIELLANKIKKVCV
ncbi:hypothetical protein OMP38_29950 [Cohnella ginsengisoli]|uniref:Uncharacterized protein n=1 Tax=Cohnella ginsengisoli TaxID=425004 RepID=A0A9X4KLR4_9BACL|nr:hypothetical protein [Cohnella ginsengisoli]MDG0794594.1 hypothetical protein [Cohnella ginsengisoli]